MGYQVIGDYTTWEVEHMHNKDTCSTYTARHTIHTLKNALPVRLWRSFPSDSTGT